MSSQARKIAGKLLARPLPPLVPKAPWDPSLTTAIDSLPDPAPVLAILHLLNDDMHNAHEVAQADENNLTSCYIHQQLHRREGDYWNSKWWISSGMRSPHRILELVHGGVPNAMKFVDDCERVGKGRSKHNDLERKQWHELTLTLDYAFENEA
ncbi:hypothetical protein BD626DRAFT_509524 [Schizophyllum amplum]|uniref:Uncharacterized protein n=1 Tax=Schizophyllum amplum TaxID=97359 RepID=A0A550C2K8_9AGAR|nr:hypothetical protein BD626DRAFT_509524 [Auriculariopsis ampla]